MQFQLKKPLFSFYRIGVVLLYIVGTFFTIYYICTFYYIQILKKYKKLKSFLNFLLVFFYYLLSYYIQQQCYFIQQQGLFCFWFLPIGVQYSTDVFSCVEGKIFFQLTLCSLFNMWLSILRCLGFHKLVWKIKGKQPKKKKNKLESLQDTDYKQ
eukprot:TRINITY_DN28730_c0_g1_i1.p2 TRINITY_DN28730_c0_g1~~TRINITY_DN28730_c0_g1_i1.p2  ORF type:complete len:166 (-),score=0.03 TRINITY_DN28730_c0_g1_i1:291-752(-)